MQILTAAPVHEAKDYAMERWLRAVAKLDYQSDLLLVDNSPGTKYVKKLREYCQKNKIKKFKIIHLELPSEINKEERLGEAREAIRQEVLKNNYDAWFSLECDIIVPPDTLRKLVNLFDNYDMVGHTYPTRGNPSLTNAELGIALIKGEVLKKYNFSRAYGFVNPKLPHHWYGNDVWFLRRIDLNPQGKRLNVSGIIKPIYHLSK